ncbi:MAG: PIG-L family deacetylase [Comamonadaceae bacterium]|nr:PIG-L family deacetylase [Comamonadaceae bacterium]
MTTPTRRADRASAGTAPLPPSGTSGERPCAARGAGVVVSPHLDDAVFGCGAWLAARPGCIVATVFAGEPPELAALTDWDVRAAASRRPARPSPRAAKRTAARPASSTPSRAGCCRSPTASTVATPAVVEISAALTALLTELRPRWVLVPLAPFRFRSPAGAFGGGRRARGLRRPHAVPGGRAVPRHARRTASPGWPSCAPPAGSAPRCPTCGWPAPVALAAKRAAVAAYASQLRAFGPGGPRRRRAARARFWRFETADAFAARERDAG